MKMNTLLFLLLISFVFGVQTLVEGNFISKSASLIHEKMHNLLSPSNGCWSCTPGISNQATIQMMNLYHVEPNVPLPGNVTIVAKATYHNGYCHSYQMAPSLDTYDPRPMISTKPGWADTGSYCVVNKDNIFEPMTKGYPSVKWKGELLTEHDPLWNCPFYQSTFLSSLSELAMHEHKTYEDHTEARLDLNYCVEVRTEFSHEPGKRVPYTEGGCYSKLSLSLKFDWRGEKKDYDPLLSSINQYFLDDGRAGAVITIQLMNAKRTMSKFLVKYSVMDKIHFFVKLVECNTNVCNIFVESQDKIDGYAKGFMELDFTTNPSPNVDHVQMFEYFFQEEMVKINASYKVDLYAANDRKDVMLNNWEPTGQTNTFNLLELYRNVSRKIWKYKTKNVPSISWIFHGVKMYDWVCNFYDRTKDVLDGTLDVSAEAYKLLKENLGIFWEISCDDAPYKNGWIAEISQNHVLRLIDTQKEMLGLNGDVDDEFSYVLNAIYAPAVLPEQDFNWALFMYIVAGAAIFVCFGCGFCGVFMIGIMVLMKCGYVTFNYKVDEAKPLLKNEKDGFEMGHKV